MFRINLEALTGDALTDVRAHVAGAASLTEDANSDLRIWLLEPGVEQPGEPAQMRPLARAVWVAARGDALVCRMRPPGESTLLVSDLDATARCEAMRAAENPLAPAALNAVRIVIVDGDGSAVTAENALEDGAACDFEIHNDGDVPVWVSLVEMGADRSIITHFPWAAGVGERIEPGAKFAAAADYMRRHPEYEPVINVFVAAAHPWVIQPGPMENGFAPCVFTLKAFVSTAPVALDLEGPVDAIVDALNANSALGWTCIHRDQTVERPPVEPLVDTEDGNGRQISPTGSGYVLVYWAEKLNGSSLGGALAVTAVKGITVLKPEHGYWTFPASGQSWPDAFRLRPGPKTGATVDPKGVPESQVASEFLAQPKRNNDVFGMERKPIPQFVRSQVEKSWTVTSNGTVQAYMALLNDNLYWFANTSMAYLPKTILEFKTAALPADGKYFTAVDYLGS